MKRISIADITLKKLSEDREVSLLFREKAAVANCADSIGADAIELPAVKSVREDSIIYKTLAKNVQNAVRKCRTPRYTELCGKFVRNTLEYRNRRKPRYTQCRKSP